MALSVALGKTLVSTNGGSTQNWTLATRPAATTDFLVDFTYYILSVAATIAISDNNSGAWTQLGYIDDHTFNFQAGALDYRKALTADLTAGTYTDTSSASPVDLMDVTALVQGGSCAFDAGNTGTNGTLTSGTAQAWPTVTPSVGGDAFIAFVAIGAATSLSISAGPTGYTTLLTPTFSADGALIAVYYKIKSSGDTAAESPTFTPSFTGAGPQSFFGLIAFKPTAVAINVTDTGATMTDSPSVVKSNKTAAPTDTGATISEAASISQDIAKTNPDTGASITDSIAIGENRAARATDSADHITDAPQIAGGRANPTDTAATISDAPSVVRGGPSSVRIGVSDVIHVQEPQQPATVITPAPPPGAIGGRSVTTAKNTTPDALVYDGLTCLTFPPASMVSNQPNSVIASALPLGVAVKVIAVSLFSAAIGGNGWAFNLCLDTAAENGMGPPDNSLLGFSPPTTAAPGHCLWATDQPFPGVANTVTVLYPVNDGWDIIWPAGHLLTARIVSPAGSLGTRLYVTAWVKPYDMHPHLPNANNPFAPSANML